MDVKFYESIDDSLLKFAVIIAKYKGKFVFCKHKERTTFEIPGGHREMEESIVQTARRELMEETGALSFQLHPVCVYSVLSDGSPESFGMLFTADIETLDPVLHCEIECIALLDALPERLTYPLIQPKLMSEAVRRGFF